MIQVLIGKFIGPECLKNRVKVAKSQEVESVGWGYQYGTCYRVGLYQSEPLSDQVYIHKINSLLKDPTFGFR